MERLIVLGTGNAQAIHCYNTCYALQKGEEYFLVDAGGGNGILTALDNNNIPLENIHHIFMSHAHTDHILGMVWMIRMIGTMMNKGTYEGELTIYCHEEMVETLKVLVVLTVDKKFYQYFDKRMIFKVVEDGQKEEILGDVFTFFSIRSKKQKQFAFTVDMDNRKKLTFLGDEPYREFELPYVERCDWLLHEAFCLYVQREKFKPYEKHHSTVKEACELAEQLYIPNLVLWHTEDKSLVHRKEFYTKEGKKYYSGNLIVPDDGEVVEL